MYLCTVSFRDKLPFLVVMSLLLLLLLFFEADCTSTSELIDSVKDMMAKKVTRLLANT